MTLENKNNNQNLINYIIKIIPKYLGNNINFKIIDDIITIEIEEKNLLFIMNFLKNHYKLQYKTLTAITAIDYPENKNRFEIVYFLLSYKLNNRLIIKLSVADMKPVSSITSIYSGAN